MKERVIKKVSVNAGGLKGLTLCGTQEIIKENKISVDSFIDGKKRPIHQDLEDKIEELRYHALDICGLITDTTTKNEKISLLGGCDVLAFEFELGETGFFKIKVSTRVFDTKVITLTTPKVDSSDGYEYFDTVMKIIESILVEIKHFVDETKVISDSELAINYIRHGKGVKVDMEEYNSLDEDGKVAFHQDMLGKLGYLSNVIHVGADTDEDIESEEISLETKTDGEMEFNPEDVLHISELSAEPIKLKA